MAVIGAHALLYSPEAEAVRQILADVFGWESADAGGGWLIFALPPAEIAVHPAEKPDHEITLMCDDLASTMAELAGAGVEFPDEPREEEWGVVVTMSLPGNLRMLLYEPRHPTPLDL